MLKPKYIEQLPAAMVELYSEVEQDILAVRIVGAVVGEFSRYGDDGGKGEFHLTGDRFSGQYA